MCHVNNQHISLYESGKIKEKEFTMRHLYSTMYNLQISIPIMIEWIYCIFRSINSLKRGVVQIEEVIVISWPLYGR